MDVSHRHPHILYYSRSDESGLQISLEDRAGRANRSIDESTKRERERERGRENERKVSVSCKQV
jgi:hypothetical protein